MMDNNNRIKELINIINKADDEYYNKNNSSISDATYDAYRDELKSRTKKCDDKELKKQAKKILTKIGADVKASEWPKASHTFIMSSLNKVNTPDELKAWAKECGTNEFVVLEKFDGISINTSWKDGVLTQALTRGDGSVGENITPNVLKMKGVPKLLKNNFTGNLRGEIMLFKSDHKKYFPDYSNPRNAASGIAKRFDGEGTEHLTVCFYQVIGKDFKTEKEQLEFINSIGLQPISYSTVDIEQVIDTWNNYQNKIRDNLDWEIDGLVVRVNDIVKQMSLGEKASRPQGQRAFKFEAETRETILKSVQWQTGSTGRITPVANFDEIELVGARIKRASLYNYAYIQELGIDIGAKIIVSRNNDVIPAVKEVSKSTGTVASYPKHCPECNAPTKFLGEYLICTNKTSCPAQRLGKLQMWVNELNILDWSEATLKRVLDSQLVSDVADLYRLKASDLAKLDRLGEKSANNLVAILDKHREIPLENLIGGLGIDGVATSTTKIIIKAGYDTLDKIQAMTVSQLEALDGFGSIRANAFYNGLKENKARIEDILSAGVSIKSRTKGKLTNKSFCFSGKSTLPRAQLHKKVEEAGGDVKKSVGKGLDYLVVADPNSTSNKTQAAKKFGTKVISEDDFMNMV